MPSALRLIPLLVGVAVLLSACVVPAPTPSTPPGAWNDCSLPEDQADPQCQYQDDPWLADDQEMDSYRLAGQIEGVRWQSEECVRNLLPGFRMNAADGSPVDLDFIYDDNSLTTGSLVGGWVRSTEGAAGDVEVRGTFTRSGDWGGPITLALDLRFGRINAHGTDYDYGTATFTFTPVPTWEECHTLFNVENMQRNLDNYTGPSPA